LEIFDLKNNFVEFLKILTFFLGNQGLCTHMTECTLLTSSIANTISGQAKCGGVPSCSLVGRCTGVLLGVSKADSPEACLTTCQSLNPKQVLFLAASTECYAGSNDHFVVVLVLLPSLVQFDRRPLDGANFQY
jgi:hypothetical protein